MTDKQIAERNAALKRYAQSRNDISRRVVKKAFGHTFGTGYITRVPAGALVVPVEGEPDTFWVEPHVFPAGSLERRDATFRGIRVPLKNTKEG